MMTKIIYEYILISFNYCQFPKKTLDIIMHRIVQKKIETAIVLKSLYIFIIIKFDIKYSKFT